MQCCRWLTTMLHLASGWRRSGILYARQSKYRYIAPHLSSSPLSGPRITEDSEDAQRLLHSA